MVLFDFDACFGIKLCWNCEFPFTFRFLSEERIGFAPKHLFISSFSFSLAEGK